MTIIPICSDMLAFYVHIPFCLSRCHYCDFVSGIFPESDLKERYVRALLREIDFLARKYHKYNTLSSLYFGGGTPSLLSAEQLQTIMRALFDRFGFSAEIEITLEANPEDVGFEIAQSWKALGINRVSLGFQSMEEEILKILGRRNTPNSNLKAYKALRKAGIENISLDFILSVSGERLEKDFETIRTLRPEHISAYILSLEKGTFLFKQSEQGIYVPKNDEASTLAYFEFRQALLQEDYAHYEISNFARDGFYSRHNLNYWQGGKYLAAGIGASGFVKLSDSVRLRWGQTPSLSRYLEVSDFDSIHEYEELIDKKTSLREAVLLGLRQTRGIDLKRFENDFHLNLLGVRRALPKEFENLLEVQDGYLRLTPQGLVLSNQVIQAVWEVFEKT